MDHSRLFGDVRHLTGGGGTLHPGLDAHEGGVAAGGVPDAQIGAVGVGQVHAALTRIAAQGHAAAGLLQEDGVVVKEGVGEGQYLSLLQGEYFHLAQMEAVFVIDELQGLAGLVKYQLVVFVHGALSQRHVESGVTAHREGHHLIVLVAHDGGHRQTVLSEGIGHLQHKAEGIGRQRLLIGGELQGKGGGLLVDDLPLLAAGKAVRAHLVGHTLVGIFVLPQAAADGEEVAGTAGPVSAVPLPQIFGAVLYAADGLQLGAQATDFDPQLLVFENIDHRKTSLMVVVNSISIPPFAKKCKWGGIGLCKGEWDLWGRPLALREFPLDIFGAEC